MKYYDYKNMGVDKLIFFIIGGFTLLVLIFIALFSIQEGKQAQGNKSIVSYSTTEQNRPKVQYSSLFSDLGNMKASDEKKADFTIENTGSKPLQIFNVSSSCDCTYGQLTIDQDKSPEFTMHSKNPWVGKIDPSKNATLSVIYRPFIMPVKGIVTREVYVQTNDPENPKLTFTVRANVN